MATQVTVSGTLKDAEGTNLSGTVTFRPSSSFYDLDGNQIIGTAPIVATLASGAFSVTLYATDDSTTVASDATYKVSEDLTGADGSAHDRKYKVEIPSASATLRYEDMVEVTSQPSYTYATLAYVQSLLDSVVLPDASVTSAKIQDGAVANADLANMAQGTIKGRYPATGTGVPRDLTAVEARETLGTVALDVDDLDLTVTAIDTATTPRPIDVIDGVVYGVVGTTLYKSEDSMASWTSIQTLASGSSINGLRPLGDGEVLLIRRADGVYKSSGWATNPATATFTQKIVPTTGATPAWVLPWGVDTDPTTGTVIVNEYAVPRDAARYVWVSTDDGDTFATKLDLNTLYPGSEASVHWHGCCIDPDGPVGPRLIASHGDGIHGIYASDDLGDNWTLITSDWQPTTVTASPDGVVCGTDEVPDGVLFIKRETALADLVVEQVFTYRTNLAGLFGFAHRGWQDSEGVVWICFESSTAGYPAILCAATDGGRRARVVAEVAATGGTDTPQWTHVMVDGDGNLCGYLTQPTAPTYHHVTATREQIRKLGAPKLDTLDPGGLLGGTADRLGVAAGAESEAGSSSTAIGLGADAAGTRATAIGRDATTGDNAVSVGNAALAEGDGGIAIGRDAVASATDAVAVGRTADATANDAVALGEGAQAAYQRSVALGQGTEATAADQVHIGQRHVGMLALASDPAAPDAGAARLYTLQNGSVEQLSLRTNDGIEIITGSGSVVATHAALTEEAHGGLVPRAEGFRVVSHGATAGTSRPTCGLAYWIGSVAPTNALYFSDLWFDTATGDLKYRTVFGWLEVGVAGFDPMSSVTWEAAWWSEDPDWTPPSDGSTASSIVVAGSQGATITQSTAGWRATYRSAAALLNSRPGLEFVAGTTQRYGKSLTSVSQTWSAIWIGTFGSFADSRVPLGTNTAANGRGIGANVTPSFYASAGTSQTGGTPVADTPYMLVQVFNGASSTKWVDGVQVGTTGNAGSEAADQFVLGAGSTDNGTTVGNGHLGLTAFAGIYSGDLTADGQWSNLLALAALYGCAT